MAGDLAGHRRPKRATDLSRAELFSLECNRPQAQQMTYLIEEMPRTMNDMTYVTLNEEDVTWIVHHCPKG